MSALLRPSSCARAARVVQRTTPAASAPASTTRAFSATSSRASGGKLEHDPPTGWLFGVKSGEKYQKEGWETPFYVMIGGLVVFSVALAFKPDTS